MCYYKGAKMNRKCEQPATLERKIWQFKPFIVCRLLGLSFDEGEVRKILKYLKLDYGGQFLADFEMHRVLSKICTIPCLESKYIDRILKERFKPYWKNIKELEPKDICRLIEGNGMKPKDVPLAALIWFAVRNQHKRVEEIEERIFAAIHVKEHRALRFYDALSQMLPEGNAEDVMVKLREMLEANEKLQRRYERSERKRKKLISEMDRIKQDKMRLAHELEEQRKLNERLREKLEKLSDESVFNQMRNNEREIGILKEEIKILSKELQKWDRVQTQRMPNDHRLKDAKEDMDKPVDCNEKGVRVQPLKGVKVAYVGGIESLMPHYKDMVEAFGCIFYYYSGHGAGWKKDIEQVVGKADVVFCPVDMNSHDVCRYVKKVCKAGNKPCYFLRSSGLSTLRKKLLEWRR